MSSAAARRAVSAVRGTKCSRVVAVTCFAPGPISQSNCWTLRVIACAAKPARVRISTLSEPTPPVAPVTTIGPISGVCPLRIICNSDSAAVKPAVPSAIDSRRVKTAGSGLAQLDSNRAYPASPPARLLARPHPVPTTRSPSVYRGDVYDAT